MLVLPAVSSGLNGSGFVQGAPFCPEAIWNAEDGVEAGLPDHDSIDAFVVYVPHSGGVVKGERAPPKKWILKSSNGSCGVFLKLDTSWPVTSSGTTSPASFTSVPDTGSCATMYSANREPNGLAFC